MVESADLESLQITIAHGGVRTSLICWSAIRIAVSSAVKIDTGGKEKDFRRLRNSGMAKAAPAEPSSSTEPSIKKEKKL